MYGHDDQHASVKVPGLASGQGSWKEQTGIKGKLRGYSCAAVTANGVR